MGFFFSNAPRNREQTIRLTKPYCLSINEDNFVRIKTQALFERILKRCYHKTAGINQQEESNIAMSMFVSVEYGAEKNGTIPLIARAMTDRAKIYLVYDPKIGMTRKATIDEQEELIDQYSLTNNANAELKGGLRGMILDFTQYDLTLLVKCYMSLIYTVMDSANTQTNMARSIQIKFADLRKNISVWTSEDAKQQANDVNTGLKEGRSVMLDSSDQVIQTAINANSIKEALQIFYSGLAADIGLSLSFVSGELTSGMSATGDADINYEDTGIKDYWVSIWRPIMLKLYGQKNAKYSSDRWRTIGQKLQNMIIVENSTLFSDEEKRAYAEEIINGTI